MNTNENLINYSMITDMLGNHEVVGDKNAILFNNIKSILDANTTSLVFIGNERKDKELLISKTQANVILINSFENIMIPTNKVLIIVDNPRLIFSKIGNCFFVKPVNYSVHPSAIIHPEAIISEKVYIGPNCVIGKGEIQENTVLYGNVFIYDNFFIGKNVRINAGTVIGGDGFGYHKDIDGNPILFPHIGGVIIEDNVDIGSNTSIDRGALADTIIRKGAKIDNLVHIAHNVIIGENAYIIANAMIGGSSSIGENSFIAPSASIKDQLKIGKDVLVGMASSVLKNIPDGEIWTGVPAQPFEKVKELNEKLKNLK